MKTLTYLFLLFVVAFTVCCKKDLPGADPNTGTDPDPNPIVKSSEKRITANPVLPGLENVAIVKYDATTFTYNITVPSDVNVKSLRLDIKISAKATISPSPATFRDYTKPVSFTVTAEDGSTQVYIISITNVKDDIPTGPSCLVQRIQNIDNGEYYRFAYDSEGRLTEIVEAVIYSAGNKSASVTEWKKMTCTYANGVPSEITIKSATPFNNWPDVVYRFTYSDKQLTTISIKDGTKKPISEAVKVNANGQLVEWQSLDRVSPTNGYTCYKYTYQNGAITETAFCGGRQTMGMSYSNVRHFLSSQAKFPAVLFTARDFILQFDKTKTNYLSFYYGYFMPTDVLLGGGTGCSAKFTTNANKFPTSMDIDYMWYLGTAFPEKKTFRYSVTYTNCN